MGFLSKMLGRGNDEEKKDLSVQSENTAVSKPTEIEKALANRSTFDLSNYKKVPLAEVTGMGGVFAQAVPMIKTAVAGGTLTDGGLARVVFPEGVTGNLAQLNSTGEYIGGIMKTGGGFAQSRLVPVNLDPTAVTTMSMAVMLAQINKKLDEIKETSTQILSFLQEKEKADTQASVNMLDDIMHRYPYNWNNENFRNNYHLKALDIKQSADAKVILYQKQIAEKISALPKIYLEKIARGSLEQLQQGFNDYRMALYLFSYASYLEVMLDGRFIEQDIKLVADKVHSYQEQYQEQFEKCRDYVQKFSGGAVERVAIGAIASAGKGLGNLIAANPRLNKGQVDEWLQDNGEKLQQWNEKGIAKLAETFKEEGETGAVIFEDSIRDVRKISNHLTGLVFDEENMYYLTD